MKYSWRYRVRRFLEIIKYLPLINFNKCRFHIVSCERNAGAAAIKCLDSIYTQKYPKDYITHVFIDDCSDDGTKELIEKWLSEHPDNKVIFKSNKNVMGLCANNVEGFKIAKPCEIVLEVNGDDWLPDVNLLKFLNKIYSKKNIWMTYNTYLYSDLSMGACREIPKDIIKKNAVRDLEPYLASHLHSFRAELFFHIKKESLIDPETGGYWKSAVDKAIYYPMFEMAGEHSVHLCRITYIYNFRDESHEKADLEGTRDRAMRLKKLPKYSPLKKLFMPLEHDWKND